MKTQLTEILDIKYPIIMAPMFLVSNTEMVKEAVNSGITGAIPALNYRTISEFEAALKELKNIGCKPFGINLIVNKSNVKFKEQLIACIENKVDFIITSLGSPKSVIDACKPKGIRVFCDVVDLKYAKKVQDLGADAIIAVNSDAGGHAGPQKASKLIPELVKECSIPIISAGGIGDGEGINDILNSGACGVSMGTIFIACKEADISTEYKQAIVDHGKKDIVLTTKLSGTPCTVINTPFVKKIGTKESWLEYIINKNKRIKKYAKMLIAYKGMKMLKKSAFNASYKNMWCAGPSCEYVSSIRPIKSIVKQLIIEIEQSSTINTDIH
ncbi:MAG: 2-nitropropane dioxygenase [Candidatus Marinimicrobia bacterium]|nr:2-nitropropane dioxygenase [Candidatus Neomarinimicrobiota bacterium]